MRIYGASAEFIFGDEPFERGNRYRFIDLFPSAMILAGVRTDATTDAREGVRLTDDVQCLKKASRRDQRHIGLYIRPQGTLGRTGRSLNGLDLQRFFSFDVNPVCDQSNPTEALQSMDINLFSSMFGLC